VQLREREDERQVRLRGLGGDPSPWQAF
jgi:hypothetical protein